MDKFLKKRSVAPSDDAPPRDAAPTKRQKTSKAKKAPAAATKKKASAATSANNKGGKIAGKTLEQHRRAMGDEVKKRIAVEKWCIEARTHCTIEGVEMEVFRRLVVPNASSVVPDPDVADEDAPVIVASIRGSDNMAAIFGASKIKGGTRMGSWSADKGECVYLPGSKEMRVWWTMR